MKEIGRNDPCPCGSGRKYKHCCGSRQRAIAPPSWVIQRPSAAPENLDTAVQCARAGRLVEAESLCERLLSREPENVSLLRLAAEVSLRLKKPNTALERIERAIALAPGNPQLHVILGDVYQALKRPAEAIAELLKAWRLAPDQPAAPDRLVAACMQEGRVEEGVAYFRAALATDPVLSACHGHLLPALATMGLPKEVIAATPAQPAIDPLMVVACSAFGNAVNRLGNVPAPSRACRNAGVLDPTCGSIYLDLFYALYGHGRLAEALAAIRALGAVEPENPTARHLVAALSGVPLERASSEYCTLLFDACASRFESRLVADLGYEVPRRLAELLERLAPAPESGWDILDLGCGTGLVGESFQRVSRSLVGVDLSGAMLEQANKRKVYSRLEKADIVEHLRKEAAAQHDLVIAADVFIYLGRLDSIFMDIHRSLRVHGRLLCSIEGLGAATVASANPSEDYALTISGRFAHAPRYIERLASRLGFVVEGKCEVALRTEQGKPSMGWLYSLRRQ